MRAARTLVLTAGLMLVLSAAAAAAPVTLTLQRTTVLYNEDPAGAPLPLGRTQYDAGDVLLNGQKIGEYLRVKDVHAGSVNAAAMTITIFLPGSGSVPIPITLQGAHDFTTGNGMGSVSATPIAGITGVAFTTTAGTLTLNLP